MDVRKGLRVILFLGKWLAGEGLAGDCDKVGQVLARSRCRVEQGKVRGKYLGGPPLVESSRPMIPVRPNEDSPEHGFTMMFLR